MNSRERFAATLDFEPVDQGLLWELGYWADAVRRWYDEGLPGDNRIPDDVGSSRAVKGPASHYWPGEESYIVDRDVSRYFGFDRELIRVPVQSWIWPLFERKIIEERENSVIEQTGGGAIVAQSKGAIGLPQMVRGPVANWEDW